MNYFPKSVVLNFISQKNSNICHWWSISDPLSARMVHILLVQQWPTDVKVLETLCICMATIGYEWQNIASGPPLSHCWTTDCILKTILKHYKPFHEQPHLLFSAILFNIFMSNLIYCFLPYYLTIFNVKSTLFQNINILRGPLLAHQLPKSVSFIIGLPMLYPRQKSH